MKSAMSETRARAGAALGFTIKSGWASAVVIGGSATLPHLIAARRIRLSDPAIAESSQPYHAGFGTARSSGPELSQLVRSVERFGRQSVTQLIRHYQSEGYKLRGAGLVVGSLIDPERIANAHIRIHALEGRLFRLIVEDGATRAGLACSTWRERDLQTSAAGILKHKERELRQLLTAVGRDAEGPWRAEEKKATLAAWLILAGGRPPRQRTIA